jgi:photosystem II stability/assembly factor-like uncharacterized protein
MKNQSTFVSVSLLILFALLVVGCIVPIAHTPAVAAQPPTQTPLPPSETSTPEPTPVPVRGFSVVHMLDENGGWAWINKPDNNPALLHTSDGGLIWIYVTPPNLTVIASGSFFLDAQTAWVQLYDPATFAYGLVRSQDGGTTWETINAKLPFPINPGISFYSSNDGWAETYDVGAGQAYVGLYKTQDGGATWSQVMLSDPSGAAGDNSGILHLCNICGDRFYYDNIRMIIIYGDLANEAAGMVRLAASFDQGVTWKSMALSFPSNRFSDGLVAPKLPEFFNDIDGLLPVGILKYNQEGATDYSVLAIYATYDGGQTWQPYPSVLEDLGGVQNPSIDIDFVSAQMAFVPCGDDLCVSQDGAQTWQPLHSNLHFTYTEGIEYVGGFHFVDPSTGWALTFNDSQSSLWKTSDGGVTWVKLAPGLAQ